MRHRYKLALCLLLLVVPMFGCGKRIVYLKGVPAKYEAETPVNKPGHGEKIYVVPAADNRGEAEKMDGNVLFVPEKGSAFVGSVTEAVKSSLSTYGYAVQVINQTESDLAGLEQPARILYTSIDSLYCRRDVGWVITDTGISALRFDLTVKGGTQPVWSRQVTKKAEVVSVWAAYQADTEKACNDAFSDSMKELEKAVTSPDFNNALTGVAGVSGGPVVSGQ